ncbi:hypothetical protein RRG08_054664 [Elysia crispata]|uniref:Uncharacterized protein n=1 Tax=Elysia crispata TaxID=231223 RepID=A0AAE1E9B2_9GAST|nr:hypothetical protein RRG08_054664 [Elysia crispata]
MALDRHCNMTAESVNKPSQLLRSNPVSVTIWARQDPVRLMDCVKNTHVVTEDENDQESMLEIENRKSENCSPDKKTDRCARFDGVQNSTRSDKVHGS